MKKLMFAVAALAAGATFAEITSSNVIGYQEAEPANNSFNYAGATFMKVGGDKDMTIGDINANDGFIFSAIQFWTNKGANQKVAFGGKQVNANYTYWADPEWTAAGIAGWYLEADEEATEPKNDVKIPFGSGFIVNKSADDEGPALVYAGEVTSKPTVVGDFDNSFNYVSGTCPRDIKISEIIGNDGFIFSAIQFWTNKGANQKVSFGGKQVNANYTYWAEAEWTAAGVAGWYLEADEEATEPMNDVVIPAGTGFIVNKSADDEDPAISLPAAL